MEIFENTTHLGEDNYFQQYNNCSFLSFLHLSCIIQGEKKKPMLSDLFIGILKGFVKD
jgi:hypothetical protein